MSKDVTALPASRPDQPRSHVIAPSCIRAHVRDTFCPALAAGHRPRAETCATWLDQGALARQGAVTSLDM